jgi:hypothetical protein
MIKRNQFVPDNNDRVTKRRVRNFLTEEPWKLAVTKSDPKSHIQFT